MCIVHIAMSLACRLLQTTSVLVWQLCRWGRKQGVWMLRRAW